MSLEEFQQKLVEVIGELVNHALKALSSPLSPATHIQCTPTNLYDSTHHHISPPSFVPSDLLKLMASELSMTISFSDKLLEYIRKNLSGVKITRWPGSTPILPENPNQAYGPQEFGLADRVGTRSLTRLDTLPP